MKMNRNGYFFDVNTKTLYMTKAFERKALQYGSEEFKLAKELRKMFPDIKTEIKVRPSKAKPLTYKQMEAFIALLPTAQGDLKEMERQKKMSVAYKSPFRYMEKWFEKKYPYHKEYMVKDENGEVIWDVASLGGRDEKQANIYAMKDVC